jgi:hypothetical protein
MSSSSSQFGEQAAVLPVAPTVVPGPLFIIDEQTLPSSKVGCLASFDPEFQKKSSQKSIDATAIARVERLYKAILTHESKSELDVKVAACFDSSFNTAGILSFYSAFAGEVTDEIKRWRKADIIRELVARNVPFMTWNAFDKHVAATLARDHANEQRTPCEWADARLAFITASGYEVRPEAEAAPADQSRTSARTAGFIMQKQAEAKSADSEQQPQKRKRVCSACNSPATALCGICQEIFCSDHHGPDYHVCDAVDQFDQEAPSESDSVQDSEDEPLSDRRVNQLKSGVPIKRGSKMKLSSLDLSLSGFADQLTKGLASFAEKIAASGGKAPAKPGSGHTSLNAHDLFLHNVKGCLANREFVNPCSLSTARLEKLLHLPRRVEDESHVPLFNGVGNVSLSIGKTEASVPVVQSYAAFVSGFRMMVGIIASIPSLAHQVQDRLGWLGWLETSCTIAESQKLEFSLGFLLDNLKEDKWMEVISRSGLKHISFLLPSTFPRPANATTGADKAKLRADKRAAQALKKSTLKPKSNAANAAANSVRKICLSREKDLGPKCRFGTTCRYSHICPRSFCKGADHSFSECKDPSK